MKLIKYLANLGYGSRKSVTALFKDGRVTTADGQRAHPTMPLLHAQLRVDGEELDPAPGVCIMLHKPIGYTCSTHDPGPLVYDLFPPRFRKRSPLLSTVGRLDQQTSGLLLLTDDGPLLHRIISPKSHLAKCYDVTLSTDLIGHEGAVFSSGTLRLRGEKTPLLPAELTRLGTRHVSLTLYEGRYHQVRRMFAALGNHVLTLHRSQLGRLSLGTLAPGQWRLLSSHDLDLIGIHTP